MKCTHIEKLLPLFIEQDLDAKQLRSVHDHLEDCVACRRLAAEFRESQDWLRETAAIPFPEFSEQSLRDSIRREIAAVEEPASGWDAWRIKYALAFSATTAILLVLGLFLWQSKPEAPVVTRSKDDERLAPLIQEKIDRRPDRLVDQRVNRRYQRRQVAQSYAHTEPPRLPVIQLVKPTIVLVDSPAALDIAMNPPGNPPEMLRIELQTADPNIRIIWFAPRDAGLSDAPEHSNR